MKKSIFVFILAFVSIAASAQDPVKSGDYWYKINSWDGSATLVANPNKEGYSGDVVIPDVVSIDGVEHKVTMLLSIKLQTNKKSHVSGQVYGLP